MNLIESTVNMNTDFMGENIRSECYFFFLFPFHYLFMNLECFIFICHRFLLTVRLTVQFVLQHSFNDNVKAFTNQSLQFFFNVLWVKTCMDYLNMYSGAKERKWKKRRNMKKQFRFVFNFHSRNLPISHVIVNVSGLQLVAIEDEARDQYNFC